ncbi:MAG: hypothetical protein NC402_05820 [Prevotella sp.]|nr:hypothetical protein [Prevotella sp.]MCM1075279.1 hypothetical protein [Ruminococcus sp.]
MKTTVLRTKIESNDILIILLLAAFTIFLVVLSLTHLMDVRPAVIIFSMLLIAGGVYFAVRAAKTGELRNHAEYKQDLSELYKLEEEDEKRDIVTETNIKLFEDDIRAIDPEVRKQDDVLTFRYQGGYFQAQTIGDHLIRISFPKIYCTGVLYQDMVCRSINRINTQFAVCKLVATPNTEEMVIEAHAFADISYCGDVESRIKYLTDIFAVFFEMQRSLLVSMSVSETLDMDSESPEIGEVTSSYKDISLN